MSAPRPYQTYPFHPPALFTPYSKTNFHIYTKNYQLFPPFGIYILSWNIAHPEPGRLTAILKSFCPLCDIRIGTRYSEALPLKLGTRGSQFALVQSTYEFYKRPNWTFSSNLSILLKARLDLMRPDLKPCQVLDKENDQKSRRISR